MLTRPTAPFPGAEQTKVPVAGRMSSSVGAGPVFASDEENACACLFFPINAQKRRIQSWPRLAVGSWRKGDGGKKALAPEQNEILFSQASRTLGCKDPGPPHLTINIDG